MRMRMVVDDNVLMVKRIFVNHGDENDDENGDENGGCGDEDQSVKFMTNDHTTKRRLPFSGDGKGYGGGGDDDAGYAGDGDGDRGRESLCMGS